MNVEVILYSGAIGLVVIGLTGILWQHNLFRMLLGLAIAEAGANILLVLAGFSQGAIAPVILGNNAGQIMNDPVPQALVLTAIVIGVGVQALALALIMKVYQHYRTLDMRIIRQKMETDIARIAGVAAPASAHSPGSAESTNSPEPIRSSEPANSTEFTANTDTAMAQTGVKQHA